MGGAWSNESLKPVSPARGIWGEYGDQRLGIPLIVDILNDYGLAATFFVDAFTDDQGYDGQTEPVCQYLLDRGQDVQLHIHPNKKHYGMKMRGEPYPMEDNFAGLSADQQLALLQEGTERMTQWTGLRPAAFRAGNMGASEQTLKQLAKVGIRVDSSYTFGSRFCRFEHTDPFNGSKWYDDVLELALSGFYQPKIPPLRPTKKVDPVGVSFGECRDAISAICGAGADAVLILHSFSLFKWRNSQFDGGRINRIVKRRFRETCRWLAEHAAKYPCQTFKEVAAAVDAGIYQAREVPPCHLGRPIRALIRKGVQGWNNVYWT